MYDIIRTHQNLLLFPDTSKKHASHARTMNHDRGRQLSGCVVATDVLLASIVLVLPLSLPTAVLIRTETLLKGYH